MKMTKYHAELINYRLSEPALCLEIIEAEDPASGLYYEELFDACVSLKAKVDALPYFHEITDINERTALKAATHISPVLDSMLDDENLTHNHFLKLAAAALDIEGELGVDMSADDYAYCDGETFARLHRG